MTTTQAALLEALTRCVKGIEHLSELARQWEPDYSSGADRRGWVLAQDAKDDAKKLIEAAALSAAEAAQPEPVAWQGLTEGERNQAVQSICEYGTGFVAPLFAVIEGVERILERRNAAPPQPAPIAAQAERCPNCDDTGDVTSIIGEWRGYCHCDAGQELAAQAVRGEVPGHGLPDWPADLQTFGERVAYQRGIGDARRIAAQAGPAQAPLTADQESRAMFVARLENMQEQGDKWLTVPAVLALLNDCDFLASRSDQATASTRPADASISGRRVDVVPSAPEIDYEELIAACYARTKQAKGTRGCIQFARGAEWFREQVLAAAPQAPAEQPADEDGADMPLDRAMHLAECWAAGKLIGGDGCGAAVALLAEVKRLNAVAPAEPAAQAVDSSSASGRTIADAAAWIEKRRDDFIAEHGATDPDTGALEFGCGAHAEAKAEYVGELNEIIEGLRALAATPAAREAGTTAGN